MPTCTICGQSITKKRQCESLKTCGSPDCLAELKRRGSKTKFEARRAAMRERPCLGCDAKFRSSVDRDGRTMQHFCPKCRHLRGENREMLFWADAWG